MPVQRAAFAASVVIFALLAACTHDFDVFEPGGDGGQAPADSSTPADAGTRDAANSGPCTPSASCLDTAKSCSKDCDTAQGECLSRCKNVGCSSECWTARDTCKKKCTTDCTACTTAAVCAAQNACESATN
jgi:hypothetical protein